MVTFLIFFSLFMVLLVGWISTRSRVRRPFWPQIMRSKKTPSKKTSISLKKREESPFHPLAKTHLNTLHPSLADPSLDENTFLEQGEAFSHLDNCVKKIEKQFFPNHREKTSKLLGETLIDQRVFSELFRSESQAIIMLYHVEEMRPIFVTMNTKRLLGFSPQDFRIRFHEIIHDLSAWKKNLYQLTWRKRLYAPIAFKDPREKSPSSLCAWDSYIAEIKRDNSSQYCVSVFYPAYCYLPRQHLLK